MSNDNSINVSHIEAAQAMIQKVRGMRQEVPNFQIPSSDSANRRLNATASVSPQFVEVTASAVDNSPVLVRAGSPEPNAVRDLVSYAEAYTPLADELEALMKFIRHSVKAARSKAGSYALTTYAITRRLAKNPETAELKPAAEAMKRELHRRKAKKSDPQPAPQTPAEPTPAT